VREVGTGDLPADWRRQPGPPELRDIGTCWAESTETAVLQVPSAVVPGEHNFLLNSHHPDVGRLAIGDPEPVVLDERLVGPGPSGCQATAGLARLHAAIIPREALQPAIALGPCALLIDHNKPSGGVTPSTEDLDVTWRMAEAGRLLGVTLLDHVVRERGEACSQQVARTSRSVTSSTPISERVAEGWASEVSPPRPGRASPAAQLSNTASG